MEGQTDECIRAHPIIIIMCQRLSSIQKLQRHHHLMQPSSDVDTHPVAPNQCHAHTKQRHGDHSINPQWRRHRSACILSAIIITILALLCLLDLSLTTCFASSFDSSPSEIDSTAMPMVSMTIPSRSLTHAQAHTPTEPVTPTLSLAESQSSPAVVVREYTLVIRNGVCGPDGFLRECVLVNNSFPAPTLIFHHGERARIHVINQLNQSDTFLGTTIHWHGIWQRRSNWADGVSSVTQCRIPHGFNLTYEFDIEQEGTFWYHSHEHSQYLDGFRGALILLPPINTATANGTSANMNVVDAGVGVGIARKEGRDDDDHDDERERERRGVDWYGGNYDDSGGALFDYERLIDGGKGNESTVLILGDWYHTPSALAVRRYLEVEHHEPQPDSIFINGLARCQRDCPQTDEEGRRPYAVVTVPRNKRVLLRIINTSGMLPFTMEIDGHPMTILQADSVDHVPHRVSELDIYTAQRYTVVIETNKPVESYWIRVHPAEGGVPGRVLNNPNLIKEARAILRYEGAPDDEEPHSEQGMMDDFEMDKDVKPLDLRDLSARHLPDERLMGITPPDAIFELKFNEGSNPTTGDVQWFVNGVSRVEPSTPALLSVLRDNFTLSSDFPVTSNALLVLEPNGVVDIHISGSARGFRHPIHLHGHDFAVLSERRDGRQIPSMRDTIQVGGSEVHMRFIADNPGCWIMHCHIDFHLEAGFAVEWIELPTQQRDIIKPPQQWFEICTRAIEEDEEEERAREREREREDEKNGNEDGGVHGGSRSTGNDDHSGASQSQSSSAGPTTSTGIWMMVGSLIGLSIATIIVLSISLFRRRCTHGRRHGKRRYIAAPTHTRDHVYDAGDDNAGDDEYDNELGVSLERSISPTSIHLSHQVQMAIITSNTPSISIASATTSPPQVSSSPSLSSRCRSGSIVCESESESERHGLMRRQGHTDDDDAEIPASGCSDVDSCTQIPVELKEQEMKQKPSTEDEEGEGESEGEE